MKKNNFIAICPKCSNPILEKITWKQRIFKISKITFFSLLLITSLFGATAIYNFLIGGIYDNPDLMVSLGGFWSVANNIGVNFQSKETKNQLKEIAFNLTKDCSNDYCKSKKIYEHLLTFGYDNTNGVDLDPIKTWERKTGDCDVMAFLLVSILRTQDINAMLQTSEVHGWAIIKLQNKTILADITQYRWEEH